MKKDSKLRQQTQSFRKSLNVTVLVAFEHLYMLTGQQFTSFILSYQNMVTAGRGYFVLVKI